IPVGKRQASHWMYWRAEPMMMIANGVMIGHHCRSFQSVQKSQSPANSCLVMSAAAPTTKAAVTQNTRSHLRSMYRYFLRTSSRSSRVLASTATLTSLPLGGSGGPPVPAADPLSTDLRCERLDGLMLLAASPEGSLLGPARVLDLLLDAEQPDRRLGPEGEDPGRQPAVPDERPVERDGEDLLGDPQAVAPLVVGDLAVDQLAALPHQVPPPRQGADGHPQHLGVVQRAVGLREAVAAGVDTVRPGGELLEDPDREGQQEEDGAPDEAGPPTSEPVDRAPARLVRLTTLQPYPWLLVLNCLCHRRSFLPHG